MKSRRPRAILSWSAPTGGRDLTRRVLQTRSTRRCRGDRMILTLRSNHNGPPPTGEPSPRSPTATSTPAENSTSTSTPGSPEAMGLEPTTSCLQSRSDRALCGRVRSHRIRHLGLSVGRSVCAQLKNWNAHTATGDIARAPTSSPAGGERREAVAAEIRADDRECSGPFLAGGEQLAPAGRAELNFAFLAQVCLQEHTGEQDGALV